MRRFLQQHTWVTGLVVLLLLVGNSGLALSRMTCLTGGHTVLSLGLAVDCCPETEKTDGPAYKAVCCELDMVQQERVEGLPQAPVQLLAEQWAMEGTLLAVALPLTALRISWSSSRPPPLSGPDRLVVFGVQRV